MKTVLHIGDYTDWERRAKGQPMSLQVCPGCQHLIDASGFACAHCGRRFRETRLQRILRISIRVMIAAIVVSAVIGGTIFLIQQGNAGVTD
ncbi:MAG: hypothetical protein AB7O26_18660 [Planctomycetaceae bacterium]